MTFIEAINCLQNKETEWIKRKDAYEKWRLYKNRDGKLRLITYVETDYELCIDDFLANDWIKAKL